MLIGVGVYDKETVSTRIDALRNEIYKASLHYGKEHRFSASIGYSMSKVKNCDVGCTKTVAPILGEDRGSING